MSFEEKLKGWTEPSSPTEQDKQDRTERMISDAVADQPEFEGVDLAVYAKGSYANNTNVKADSDVDIAVECCECIYWDEAESGIHDPANSYEGPWTPDKLRSKLTAALQAKFPGQVDTTGRVAIGVNSSTARVDADVVPCFTYHYYYSSNNYCEGTKIFPTAGSCIVNYPQQQLAKGRSKNKRTNHAYKKTVRILKRVANAMAENGEFRQLPSYFIECLVYNCSDSIFGRSTWTSIVKGVLFQIWDELQGKEPDDSTERWVEANECFYLFYPGQDWTRTDGREFAHAAWNYLGLADE